MKSFTASNITSNVSIHGAIERLSKEGNPAVIVNFYQGKYLFTGRQLVLAYIKGIETCEQLDLGSALSIEQMTLILHSSQSESYSSEQVRHEVIVDKNGNAVAFVDAVDEDTWQIGASEVIYQQLFSGRNIICVCGGDDRHMVEGDISRDGKGCDYCLSTYTCLSSF